MISSAAHRFFRALLGWGMLGIALLFPIRLSAQTTAPLTLTVNSAATLTSFYPISIFGANAGYWISDTDNMNVQPLVQGAGNYFIRYPGGSSSDDYHWNGTGVGPNSGYDANGYWMPSGTSYSPGFQDYDIYTGSTSSYGVPSNLTDGDTSTVWLSNVDTDFPNHQWAELDLTGPDGNESNTTTTVNAVTIVWGTPGAATFQVQYWGGPNNYPPPYMRSPESQWTTTSSGTLSGTGAGTTQGVTFTAVNVEFIRVLLTSSTAGAGGAYSIAELYVYGPTGQVSKNTSTLDATNQPAQTWGVVSSMDPASSLDYTTAPPQSTDFASFMNYIHSFSPNAIPLITVNFGTGTASEAASWVNYANNVMGYGIKYWQIGNETEGAWETGGPINTQDYVRRYIEYFTAMKAVDNSIVITGPVAGSFLDPSNLYDGKSAVQDFIQYAAAAGVSLYGNPNTFLGAIDYHWYPNYGNYPASQALTSTGSLDSYPASLQSWYSAAGVSGGAQIPVMMSEYNADPSNENFQVQLGNGLFIADALGHFIKAFGPVGFSNVWATLNGGNASTTVTGGDLGYLNVLNDGYQYQPRADYWTMKMMTNDWAIPGDSHSHQLVQVSTNSEPNTLLASYSDYRPDGVLSLAVVNKDPVTVFNSVVSVAAPFTANNTAIGWTFNSSNYQWVTTGSPPYHASPDAAPITFLVTGSGGAFPVTFQPYSLTVLQFTNSSYPTNTATSTPTITSTPTATNTPNYGPLTLVDNFDDLTRDGPFPPTRTNLWNGAWNTSVDALGSGITVQYGTATGAAGSAYAAKIFGNIVTNGWSNYQTTLSLLPPIAYNLSGAGIVGLEFWFYGDGATYRFEVEDLSALNYDYYGIDLTPPKNQWTFYQIPFSMMVTQGWGSTVVGPATPFSGADATGIQIATQAKGAFTYEIDQIGFYSASGLSPTLTPSTTATNLSGFTSTPTPSGTPTLSATITSTALPCGTALQSSYTFDTGTQCWKTWGGPVGSVLQWDSADGHTNTGSLEAIFPYASGSVSQAIVYLDFSTTPIQVPAGSTISLWYKASSATGTAQVFDASITQGPGGPVSWNWNVGAWQGTLATSWTQVTFTLNPAGPNAVEQIGFQVPGSSGSITAPVTVWIDDVTFTLASTPTVTSTPTPSLTPTLTLSPTVTLTVTPTNTNLGGATSTLTLSPTQTASPSPSPTGVLYSTCSQNYNLTVGSYVVESNYWNPTGCPGTQCMTINGTTGAFGVTQGPNCGDTVASYPNVLYGCSFGECSPGSVLPMPVSLLSCVTSSWNFSVGGNPSTDAWDVAYDIWFCPTNTCGGSGFAGGTELMIWLNYNNTAGWQNHLATVSLSGSFWEVWQATQGSGANSWNYLAYLADAQTSSVSNLNLMAFFQDALSRGYIQNSWYLYAVQAGDEIRSGGMPYISNSFSVSVNNGCGTITPTRTATNSPTATASVTPSVTATLTLTATTSPTPNVVLTSTGTPTGTATSTSTASFTVTSTATFNATATLTPTASLTFTGTPSPTGTNTATLTATPSVTASQTPTVSLTSTGTASPTTTPTPPPILDVAYPNPWKGTVPLGFFHTVPAGTSSVSVKLYTVSYRKVFESEKWDATSGTHLYQLSWNQVGNLSNGLYYLVVTDGSAKKTILKLLILR